MKKTLLLLYHFFLVLFSKQCLGQTDGSIDPGFGIDGRITTRIKNYATVGSIAFDAEGSIFACGHAESNGYKNYFAIAKYDHNGIQDSSFGITGVVVFDVSYVSDEEENDILIQRDGKILATVGSSSIMRVYRLNKNGTLDTSFNHTGFTDAVINGVYNLSSASLQIQNDNKIIICGHETVGERIFIARFNPDGRPDSSYNEDGILKLSQGYRPLVYDSELQHDGKLIIAGTTEDDNFFMLLRLQEDGRYDDNFGDNGKVIFQLDPSMDNIITEIELTPDNKILAAGYASNYNSFAGIIMKFNSDGTIDSGFGENGFIYNYDCELKYFALQADGGMLSGCGISRYIKSGELDRKFGYNGSVYTDCYPTVIKLQADGKIILGGMYNGEFALERYLNNFPGVHMNQNAIFYLYPNPFAGEINLQFYQPLTTEIIFSISDLSGRCIRKIELDQLESIYTIAGLDDLPTGLYFASIQMNDMNYSYPIIKQ